jgi:hypothetical protein
MTRLVQEVSEGLASGTQRLESHGVEASLIRHLDTRLACRPFLEHFVCFAYVTGSGFPLSSNDFSDDSIRGHPVVEPLYVAVSPENWS